MSVANLVLRAMVCATRAHCGKFVGTMALTACAAGPYVPPEAIDPPAAQLSTAVASFASLARSSHLTMYRDDVRRDQLTAAVRDALTKPSWTAVDLRSALETVPPVDFLCLPNWRLLKVSVHFANIETVGAALGNRAQAPTSDIPSLLSALGSDYAIHPGTKEAPGPYTTWLQGSPDTNGKLQTPEGKLCSDSVAAGNPYRTRNLTDRNAGAIVAALALIDTVWNVLKPVMVGTLQNIDTERRAQAIKEFFNNRGNVAHFKADLQESESFLDDEFMLARARAAGRAVATAAVLFDAAQPYWQKAIAAAGTTQCRPALSRLVAHASDAPGVACLDALFAATQKALDAALKAADDFDTALGQSLPSKEDKLSSQVDTLRKIALGENPPDEQVKALWAATLRYATLFQTVNTAVSPANQKQIVDATTTLAKALGVK